jgi:RNA polymerase sigma factor (sigma-70 family)
MPRTVRWSLRKGASDRRMELSIPWTIARPVAEQPPARRSQGLTSDDPDLVGRAREGDQVAFARLFEQYHAPILNYLHRMVGDRAMAEDLTQDTFIKAYNALPSTRPDLAFKPWLYRIATNTAISQLRRRKIVQWIPFLPGHDHASDQSVERAVGRRQDIEQTLSRLPQHYAAALLLRHYQGMSLAETADALGITENAAKLRLFRARKAFAEIYGSAEALAAPEKWEAQG